MSRPLPSIPKEITLLLLLSVALTLLRIAFFHVTYFLYILWNIFLALLPFIVSSILLFRAKYKKSPRILFYIGGFLWLLLLPNAPYIVTDIIHLGHGRADLVLYDTFMIFSAAWVGLLLGIYSISHIEQILLMKYPKKVTAFILAGVFLITAFGIYLGRFLRFNSWDIFSHPLTLVRTIGGIVSQPSVFPDAYSFTLFAFLFISLTYTAWRYSRIDYPKNI